MRLEIVIPDTTRPDLAARIANLTRRLSARPELVDELTGEKEDPTPDYAASIAQIRQSTSRFNSPEEVDAYLAELRDEW